MALDRLHEGDKIPFSLNDFDILLIKINEKIHIIENRCGHFGVPLMSGILGKDSIKCSHHFAKFDLRDGSLLNDTVSECDAIKIFKWRIENQKIIVCFEE